MANDNVISDTAKPEDTPAAAPPTQAAPPINPQMPIQLVLTVEQINICLAGVAKLPLEHALNTFQVLKGQGDMAIAVAQGIAGKLAQGETPGPNGANRVGRRQRKQGAH